VQGIRMGCREIINERRDRLGGIQEQSVPESRVPGSVDDVVRYLRQQDDVVVAQGDGEFLVNARFRLSLTELVGRANRMRARQGKPEFGAPSHQPTARMQSIIVANGHHQ
jgi:hypothetical protein